MWNQAKNRENASVLSNTNLVGITQGFRYQKVDLILVIVLLRSNTSQKRWRFMLSDDALIRFMNLIMNQ